MAFLDDMYVVTRPERIGAVYVSLQNELFAHSGIVIHGGKTRVWNSGGVRPPACDALERIARATDADENVWRGSQLPVHEQGIEVLGTPLGHPAFVSAHLDRISTEHQVFLERIPSVPDLLSAWVLLLHCAAARATYLLRTLPPEAVARFAEAHDEGLWRCMCWLLGVPQDQDAVTKLIATLPLVLGGVGLRSAARTRQAAFWASWADCLSMIRERHPELADELLLRLEGGANTPALSAALRGSSEVERSHGDSFHRLGQLYREEPGLQIGNQKILNRACREGVGNTKLLLEWSRHSEQLTCSLFCQNPGELW